MIEVRALSSHEELLAAVQLQQQIWGFDEIELIPLRLFVTATKVGGHSFGAFDGKRMIGFCLAIPGIKPGHKVYLHSHMLGVLPEYRNAGVGRMLKLAQREDAMSRNIDLIEWTFDPLEIKNAYFNIERLGAVVRRFVLNQYGLTTSHLHGSLPTDRCIAEWWLSSPRAEAIIAGNAFGRGSIVERVAVPSDIATLRIKDPGRAREIQAELSEKFLAFFARDLAVIGFEKSETAGTYLFGHWDHNRCLGLT
jgi:predicted GNAT superfamily acetyltransferase